MNIKSLNIYGLCKITKLSIFQTFFVIILKSISYFFSLKDSSDYS